MINGRHGMQPPFLKYTTVAFSRLFQSYQNGITNADVQAVMGKLLETLAPDTVRTIHRCLSKILSTAMGWSYVDENVTRGIRLPAPRRREPPFLPPEQFQNLLAGLPEKIRVMILLVMMTSMRVCEILALRWRRVDLRTGTLRITERFYRGDFSSVKSKRSDRDLPLGSVALETLKNWREKRKGGPDDLVFATRTGKPMSDGNVRRRLIYPTCDRLGIPRVNWHGFRHLHSSLLAYLGIPVAVAQAQLGHADPRITLEIYTHMVSGAQREAAWNDWNVSYCSQVVPKLRRNRRRRW
jgi:integrase